MDYVQDQKYLTEEMSQINRDKFELLTNDILHELIPDIGHF